MTWNLVSPFRCRVPPLRAPMLVQRGGTLACADIQLSCKKGSASCATFRKASEATGAPGNVHGAARSVALG